MQKGVNSRKWDGAVPLAYHLIKRPCILAEGEASRYKRLGQNMRGTFGISRKL